MPPHSKQFSIVADPAFTEVNKTLDAFVKELRKSGNISGVVHKKAISKQQVETIYKLIKLIGYISLTFSDWLLTSGNNLVLHQSKK